MVLPRLAASVLLACSSLLAAEPAQITVDTSKPGVAISPTLYGIFFEEINRAGDGGLYAEMIQNRSFEDSDNQPNAWTVLGDAKVALDRSKPVNGFNKTSLRLEVAGEGGIANDGFAAWGGRKSNGLALRAGEHYKLSLYARGDAKATADVVVRLLSHDGKELASADLGKPGEKWQQLSADLVPSATDAAGRLAISAKGPAKVWLDQISLMPAETWKGLPFRRDLGDMVEAMHPAFIRFPGGCFVEGFSVDSMERWKNGLGEPAERVGHDCIWGYKTTGGLGFHEFLLWCEALNAEPLYVINVGMCHDGLVPMDRMGQWVQDALDLVEYARGPADSVWGSLRAKAGHPQPFRLNYIEIGNENGGTEYAERYALFHDALKAKYPDLTLIANRWFWKDGYPRNRSVAMIDEHDYSNPREFVREFNRFDKYDRNGPKIYMGEYAVTTGCGTGNLKAAVAESVYMMGMERNSDIVRMASYAPLFANVAQKAWNPDAIDFDAGRAYGTPSYYVQCMFAQNRGDVNLATDVRSDEVVLPRTGVAGVGTWATQAQYKDIRITSDGKTLYASDFSKGASGFRPVRGDWRVADGVLEQTSAENDCRDVIGEKTWGNYTISLKARKTGGAEGFLVMFTSGDGNEQCWWNIGGWGNSQHALEFGSGPVNPVPGHIETGRWYDIRVETGPEKVRCYLDDKLVHEVAWPTQKAVYAQASRVEKSGEVILKLANTSSDARKVVVSLGQGNYASDVQVQVLSGNPDDENSLEAPTRIAPRKELARCQDGKVTYVAPASSVSVLRVRSAQ